MTRPQLLFLARVHRYSDAHGDAEAGDVYWDGANEQPAGFAIHNTNRTMDTLERRGFIVYDRDASVIRLTDAGFAAIGIRRNTNPSEGGAR